MRLFVFAAFATTLATTLACSSEDTAPKPTATTSSTGSSGGGDGSGGGGEGGGGMAPNPSAICEALGLPVRELSPGPYGYRRGEIADDFVLPLFDGTEFRMKERWSGCESHVFVPDRIPVSDADDTSVWESDEDLADLVAASPKNVHWFFFSRWTNDADVAESLGGMQARIDALLASMPAEDRAHWRERLHVVGPKASVVEGWIGDAMRSHGKLGFGIDRLQRVRGAGSLADVDRFSSQLQTQGAWPWKSNLAYAAHEPLYYDAQAELAEKVESRNATIVTLFDGEVLEELADTTVTLPSATEMAEFDTLEVEVTMQCPNPDTIELGNCGAWDYIANLFVMNESQELVEIARFITTYHREAHWVVDVSPMLVHLASGGQKSFRWSFAPSWNTQPTATKLSLRLSDSGRGMRPTQATFLWSGGPFDSNYDALHPPVDVPIPSSAKKVELWAIVTGHGMATNNCAEFCNHQHEFTIGGATYTKEHTVAGTDDGCIAELAKGMTPNQAGTWWFGRGGWCPGQQVDPWVVDVTKDVTPGQTATVSYTAKMNGKTPPDGAGDIVLSSYLVVWE